MKFQVPGTSPFFEAFIVAPKNNKLNEFSTVEHDGRVMQTFVPVQDSMRLKLVCKTNELMKGSIIDLVVDGILRDTYIHQKKQPENVTIKTFESGIYKSGKSLRRGKFTVHACPSIRSYPDGHSKVGTIELRLHRAHTSDVSTKKDIPDPEETNSYADLPLPWNSHGVAPDADIGLTGEAILSQSGRISYRRAFALDRPGHSAWSTLRFIYRQEQTLRDEKLMGEGDLMLSPLAQGFIELDDENSCDDEDASVKRETFKTESPVAVNESAASPQKRKRDEVKDIVDEITFGQYSDIGTPNSLSSRYSTPSKRTTADIEALEKEVVELTNVAAQNKRRANDARAKLAERVRKRTELDRKYEELMARKKKAQEEIAKSNREEELYMRQLNNEESD